MKQAETMSSEALETYEELLAALQALTPEQLAQPIQVGKIPADEDTVVALKPVVMFATVEGSELKFVRSSVDNRMNRDELVLFYDSNPFGKRGSMARDLATGELIYSGGYDESTDWTGPAQRLALEPDLIEDGLNYDPEEELPRVAVD
jgi:hypothetical protein